MQSSRYIRYSKDFQIQELLWFALKGGKGVSSSRDLLRYACYRHTLGVHLEKSQSFVRSMVVESDTVSSDKVALARTRKCSNTVFHRVYFTKRELHKRGLPFIKPWERALQLRASDSG